MFKKILKWVGILLAGLVALLIIGLISLYFITMDKLNKVYEIPPSGITVSSDAESIAARQAPGHRPRPVHKLPPGGFIRNS